MDAMAIDTSYASQIPYGWSKKQLQDVAQLINGRGFKPFEWDTSGLPIIRIQNLNGSDKFNHYSGRYDPKIEVDHGQLLFAWSGSRGTSFGPHIWNGPKGVLNYHTWKVRVHDGQIAPHFFFHVLRHLTRIIEDQAHEASALVHVQKWEMEKFPFQCPDDLKEQEAIAEALSDADALIEGLERLIAKKRLIKQGAMQDLLTAKRRLPGFSGKWEIKKFGDIARIRNQKIQTFDDNRASKCVELEQIEAKTGRVNFWTSASDRKTIKYVFAPGDVLFGRLRPYLRKYFFTVSEGVCSTEIWPLMAVGVTSSFLYHVVQSEPFVAAACESYGTHMPRADWGKLLTFELSIPEDTDEQDAIGSVLLDIDAEIQVLETRLHKTRQVKEGMMQNLLTGRIRLV